MCVLSFYLISERSHPGCIVCSSADSVTTPLFHQEATQGGYKGLAHGRYFSSSECDVFLFLGHGLDVVRHPFDRGSRNQISSPNLSGHCTGAAHPDRHASSLHGCQQVFEGGQIHALDMIGRPLPPERHCFIPEPEHHIVSLLLSSLRRHEG